MRLSTAKPKVVGLQLGEASINLIRPDAVPIKAKLAIIGEEESACGYIEKHNGWSEKTLAALQELASCIEADALPHLFFEEDPATKEESQADPPQF
jgi:hypothetical protein